MSDDEDDPLDHLTEMGFSLTQASDALLQSNGDLHQAIQLLTSSKEEAAAAGTSKETPPKKEKRKKKKQQHKQPNNNKSFKDQRKEELRFKKALRDKKKTCRVCGGPHPRSECPGIADDGRGHSRHHAPATKGRQQRKQWQEEHEQDQHFLQLGVWTEACPYFDGFANLVACWEQQNDNKDNGMNLAEWMKQWADRSVSLGDESIGVLTLEQRKAELKRWAGSKLRELVESLLGGTAVVEDLQRSNPRSAMIQHILNHEFKDDGTVPQRRTLEREWPGYRGCLCPVSVLENTEILPQQECNDGVKVLLSIAPNEIAKWMQVTIGSETAPIDLAHLTRLEADLQRTQAEAKKAAETLLASKKAGRASAEAEVARLRKLIISKKRARQVDNEAVWKRAAKASLCHRVGELFQQAMEISRPFVAGLSCGLDYESPEARHPRYGPAIRQAQREVCTMLMKTSGLPLVLECNDVEDSTEASDDLVRIMAEHAPPDSTVILRIGALTVAPKPGLTALLQTWPKLYIGLSAKLAFAKCPKSFLDVAFDLSLDRLILTSEAPMGLPPVLGGSFVETCLPPHVACVAESIADIKGTTVTREGVLEASMKNISNAFGIDLS